MWLHSFHSTDTCSQSVLKKLVLYSPKLTWQSHFRFGAIYTYLLLGLNYVQFLFLIQFWRSYTGIARMFAANHRSIFLFRFRIDIHFSCVGQFVFSSLLSFSFLKQFCFRIFVVTFCFFRGNIFCV